mmetsp:Transcript_11301/g.47262  ORF Transcript_11301/g.47262 Transcript_11301/m.47262 type:complete len:264 (+) Transcript_11301:1169-1960(+)
MSRSLMSTRRRSTFVPGDAPGADAGANPSPEVPTLPSPTLAPPRMFRSALNLYARRSTNTRSLGPYASIMKWDRYPRPAPSSTYAGDGLVSSFASGDRTRTRPAAAMCETMDACCRACLGLNGAMRVARPPTPPPPPLARAAAAASLATAASHIASDIGSGVGMFASMPASEHARRTLATSALSSSPRGRRTASFSRSDDDDGSAPTFSSSLPRLASRAKYGMDSAPATLRYAGHLPACFFISRVSTGVPQCSHGTLSEGKTA